MKTIKELNAECLEQIRILAEQAKKKLKIINS